MPRDQAHQRTERDDGDDAVEGREQCRHLVADLADVSVRSAGRGGLGFGLEFLRAVELRPGQRGDDAPSQRDAMPGDRHHRDAAPRRRRRLALTAPGAQRGHEAGHRSRGRFPAGLGERRRGVANGFQAFTHTPPSFSAAAA